MYAPNLLTPFMPGVGGSQISLLAKIVDFGYVCNVHVQLTALMYVHWATPYSHS